MDSLFAARALTDTLLRTWSSPSANQAGFLASLATLTGRARRASALAAKSAADTQHVPFASSAGRHTTFPLPVVEGALELRVYAALGGPGDSLRSTFLRTNRLVDMWIAPSARADARQALFRNAFSLAYDSLAPLATFTLDARRDLLLAMRMALGAGDTSGARRLSAEFDGVVSRFLPGTMGTDRQYQHARVLLALGDTASAVARLDDALAVLPRVRSIITEVPPQAGAVARAMILRAQLAMARGDRGTAERWTRSAFVLWGDADAELRAPLDGLRRALGYR
jgi:hypothetical protein